MSFFEGLFRSLEAEMNSRFADMSSKFEGRFDRVEARLDRIETRMDRIGGVVNGGSRALARLIEWSERTDQLQVDTLRRIEDLDKRVTKIESDKNGK
jgi:hypothetical protein